MVQGLYNMGVFLENGQAGFERDPQAALAFFEKAANASRPFPLALAALGQHHRLHPTQATLPCPTLTYLLTCLI